MRYSEQADLLAKVKKVCESVNSKEQIPMMQSYARLAAEKMTDPDLRMECRKIEADIYTAFYPVRKDYAQSKLEQWAMQQSVCRQMAQNRANFLCRGLVDSFGINSPLGM